MKAYIGIKDVMEITGFSYNTSAKVIKQVRAEMKSDGYELFEAKELLALKSRVFKKLGIKEKELNK